MNILKAFYQVEKIDYNKSIELKLSLNGYIRAIIEILKERNRQVIKDYWNKAKTINEFKDLILNDKRLKDNHCGNNIAITLHGRYAIYRGEQVFAFVKWN